MNVNKMVTDERTDEANKPKAKKFSFPKPKFRFLKMNDVQKQ